MRADPAGLQAWPEADCSIQAAPVHTSRHPPPQTRLATRHNPGDPCCSPPKSGAWARDDSPDLSQPCLNQTDGRGHIGLRVLFQRQLTWERTRCSSARWWTLRCCTSCRACIHACCVSACSPAHCDAAASGAVVTQLLCTTCGLQLHMPCRRLLQQLSRPCLAGSISQADT